MKGTGECGNTGNHVDMIWVDGAALRECPRACGWMKLTTPCVEKFSKKVVGISQPALAERSHRGGSTEGPGRISQF